MTVMKAIREVAIKEMGVKVVNSLDELREVMLLWEHPGLS